MSGSSGHEDVAARNPILYPPRLAAQPEVDAESIDGSGAIFALYLEMSLKEDKEMVGFWNQDAKSILLFSGLFSATVAAALGPTLPNLTSNSQDVSTVYLELMYDQLVGFNGSQPVSVVSNALPGFQLVSSLWFLSLVSSVTCALLSISLQQWTHRYLMDVQRRCTLCSQARIRQYLAEGIRDSGIAVLVDAMRACHQLSFMLFAIGLSVYFSLTTFVTGIVVVTWFSVWASLYLWMTMAAVSRHNTPYRSPLASILYRFFQLVRLVDSTPARPTSHSASNGVWKSLKGWSPDGMRKVTEGSAKRQAQDLYSRILEWTFNALNQDHEFERFFAGIPDFCDSRAVKDPNGCLSKLNGKQELSRALFEFMDRTVTSPLISEQVRLHRVKICLKVIDALPTLVSWSTLRHVFERREGLGSAASGGAASRTGGNSNRIVDPCTALYIQCIFAILSARVPVYDGDWFDLATQFLTPDKESEDSILSALRGSLEPEGRCKSSALLANLILITRIIIRFHSDQSRGKLCDASSETLCELSSKVDASVLLASSEIQREFCHLWNTLVRHHARMREPNGSGFVTSEITENILRYLFRSYIALHESKDAPTDDDDTLISLSRSSYQLCLIQDHHHASSQTRAPTDADPTDTTNPPSGPMSPRPFEGATEGAEDVSSPAEASNLTAAHSASPPSQAAHLSHEITPVAQESHDNHIGTPASVIHSPVTSFPDVT